jgi:hypothetical protein
MIRRLAGTSVALALIGLATGSGWAQTLTPTQEGMLGGGVLGAGAGAIAGAAVHHPIVGALVGGGLGAVAGGAVGQGLAAQGNTQMRMQEEVDAQQRQIQRQREEIRQLQSEQTE